MDADDAFEGEVGLVGEQAREVVGALLVGGDQAVLDEVVGPLAQVRIVGGQVGGVACFLRVGEGHDQHVAAFFDGLFLGDAVGVAGAVGVVGADVVEGEVLRVQPVFLDDVEGVEQVFQPGWVEVEEDWRGGEDYVCGVHVAVGGDFFHEDVGALLGASDGGCAEGFAGSEGNDGEVVLAAYCDGVVCDLAV